jgi:hypothetical protein
MAIEWSPPSTIGTDPASSGRQHLLGQRLAGSRDLRQILQLPVGDLHHLRITDRNIPGIE